MYPSCLFQGFEVGLKSAADHQGPGTRFFSQKHITLCNLCASIAGGGFSSRVHPSQARYTTLAVISIHPHHQKVQEMIKKLKIVKNTLPTSFLPSHLQRDLHLKTPSGLQGFNLLVELWEQINNRSVVPTTRLCTHWESSGALPDPSTSHRGCHPWAGGIWACLLNILGQKSEACRWAPDGTWSIISRTHPGPTPTYPMALALFEVRDLKKMKMDMSALM